MPHLRRPSYIVSVLVTMQLVCFVIMRIRGLPSAPSVLNMIHLGAIYGSKAGQGWWRLPLALFVHARWWRLALNNSALLILDQILTTRDDVTNFLIYLFSGLIGLIVGVYMSPDAPIYGSSGAVFGLLSCEVALRISQSGWRSLDEAGQHVGATFVILSTVVFGFGNWSQGILINVSACFIGLLAGFSLSRESGRKYLLCGGLTGALLATFILAFVPPVALDLERHLSESSAKLKTIEEELSTVTTEFSNPTVSSRLRTVLNSSTLPTLQDIGIRTEVLIKAQRVDVDPRLRALKAFVDFKLAQAKVASLLIEQSEVIFGQRGPASQALIVDRIEKTEFPKLETDCANLAKKAGAVLNDPLFKASLENGLKDGLYKVQPICEYGRSWLAGRLAIAETVTVRSEMRARATAYFRMLNRESEEEALRAYEYAIRTLSRDADLSLNRISRLQSLLRGAPAQTLRELSVVSASYSDGSKVMRAYARMIAISSRFRKIPMSRAFTVKNRTAALESIRVLQSVVGADANRREVASVKSGIRIDNREAAKETVVDKQMLLLENEERRILEELVESARVRRESDVAKAFMDWSRLERTPLAISTRSVVARIRKDVGL